MYVYPGSFGETGPWAPTYELWRIHRDSWLLEFPSVVRRYEQDRLTWTGRSLKQLPPLFA